MLPQHPWRRRAAASKSSGTAASVGSASSRERVGSRIGGLPPGVNYKTVRCHTLAPLWILLPHSARHHTTLLDRSCRHWLLRHSCAPRRVRWACGRRRQAATRLTPPAPAPVLLLIREFGSGTGPLSWRRCSAWPRGCGGLRPRAKRLCTAKLQGRRSSQKACCNNRRLSSARWRFLPAPAGNWAGRP